MKRLLLALGLCSADDEPIAFEDDEPGTPYLAFEWIGRRNYLGELKRGKVAADGARKREFRWRSLARRLGAVDATALRDLGAVSRLALAVA